jgi:hypothetical protein
MSTVKGVPLRDIPTLGKALKRESQHIIMAQFFFCCCCSVGVVAWEIQVPIKF